MRIETIFITSFDAHLPHCRRQVCVRIEEFQWMVKRTGGMIVLPGSSAITPAYYIKYYLPQLPAGPLVLKDWGSKIRSGAFLGRTGIVS